jgi:hypothetical protein
MKAIVRISGHMLAKETDRSSGLEVEKISHRKSSSPGGGFGFPPLTETRSSPTMKHPP